jgi:hypothetical protein
MYYIHPAAINIAVGEYIPTVVSIKKGAYGYSVGSTAITKDTA